MESICIDWLLLHELIAVENIQNYIKTFPKVKRLECEYLFVYLFIYLGTGPSYVATLFPNLF
jgi:hypothetical protein